MDNEIDAFFEKPRTKRFTIHEWETWETLEEVDKLMMSSHPEWEKTNWSFLRRAVSPNRMVRSRR